MFMFHRTIIMPVWLDFVTILLITHKLFYTSNILLSMVTEILAQLTCAQSSTTFTIKLQDIFIAWIKMSLE